ncbi:MAG: hypothetical protein MUF72_21195 [Elainella sp. Prado103]|nr:hypothetical protein [Elainella sp. Prado103]
MTVTARDLIQMSQAELDQLYRNSPVGALPDGDSQGTALFFPGSWLSRIMIPVIKWLAWQGKVFHPDEQFLLNKILPLRLRLVKAAVYPGESWIDGQAATILDYSKTSFIAQKIRDEIREVAPNLYLGQAYWGKTRVLNFILEF